MRNAAPRERPRLFGARRLHLWFAALTCVLSVLIAPSARAQQAKKNVLVLFSAVKYSEDFLNFIEPVIRSRVPGQITFYDAYLDDLRTDEESYRKSEAETFRLRYSGVHFDLVIVANPPALYFADDYRDTMFPGVPIVFAGVSRSDLDRQKSWPGVTGVTSTIGFRETVDLALRLEPDTNEVAVVTGITPWDADNLRLLHSALAPHHARVTEVDLAESPGPDALARVEALPPHTIVIFQELPEFSHQPEFGTWDLLDAVAQRRPTYSVYTRLCIDGCIGGVYEDTNALFLSTAQLASRVLRGENPDNIPIIQNTTLHAQVDWRALQRWHISERALPPGSVVLFREPGLWERGKNYFLLGLLIIVLEAILILGLLRQHAKRKKIEAALRTSEEKFSKAFRDSPLAVTIASASDGRYIDVNETFEERTGWRRDEIVGRTPVDISLWVDPAQRSRFIEQIRAEGTVRNIEVRFRTKEGQIRTSLGSAELIEVGGQSCILSVIADITERKAAEEALASVSGRLIEAQEAERARIARELHDDINQRLAMVAVTLKTLKQYLPSTEVKAAADLEDACKRIADLGDDVQALSHRLHSSKLEYLGLEVASRSFCAELSERQNVEIDFRSDGIPEEFSGNIALCLFRVLQEAVHNALKYSGVRKFDVLLTGGSDEIQLRVQDSGAGFDPTATNGHGLGLTSMKERLNLVNGELSIDSKPQRGTTILARVPLTAGAVASAQPLHPDRPGFDSETPEISKTHPDRL